MENEQKWRSTTILAVHKDGHVAMGGDGQVSLGNTVMKSNARKVRRIYDNKVLVGFAGATADAFTLFERFESKVELYKGNVKRASVELAKEWRTDKVLRRLEAMLLVASVEHILVVSGTGDVVEPETGAIAIGSGGNYAYSAALAYLDCEQLTAVDIVKRSMAIAGSICVFSNQNIIVEEVVGE